MNRIKVASELIKLAKELLADTDFIKRKNVAMLKLKKLIETARKRGTVDNSLLKQLTDEIKQLDVLAGSDPKLKYWTERLQQVLGGLDNALKIYKYESGMPSGHWVGQGEDVTWEYEK